MTELLTKDQITEVGETIGKALKEDLGKHITELLPEAFKSHGLDMSLLKQPINRPPMAGSISAEIGNLRGRNLGYFLQLEKRLRERGFTLERDEQWPVFGEFLKGLYNAGINRTIDSRLKANNEETGSAGGFLVPDAFVANLLMVALEQAIIRPRAMIVPMAGEHVKIPAVQDTSHATNVYGGVQAYWTAESGAATESNAVFRQIGLTAKKLMGYTTVTNELLADSAIALEAILTRMFGDALAYFEDDAFIDGSGAGMPLGLLNSPALISVAKETGQAATTIVVENLDKMYSRMLPSSLNRAVWLAHPDTQPQLFALARSVGTGGSAVMVTNIANAPATSIYGRPVIITEKCKTLGTLGDIYFVDLSYYVIGDRQGMTMAASPHVRFTNGETVYLFTERVDGQPWINSAITPREGSNTLSPMVALAARS